MLGVQCLRRNQAKVSAGGGGGGGEGPLAQVPKI